MQIDQDSLEALSPANTPPPTWRHQSCQPSQDVSEFHRVSAALSLHNKKVPSHSQMHCHCLPVLPGKVRVSDTSSNNKNSRRMNRYSNDNKIETRLPVVEGCTMRSCLHKYLSPVYHHVGLEYSLLFTSPPHCVQQFLISKLIVLLLTLKEIALIHTV